MSDANQLRELTNPVFNTAKATLQGLSNCKDPDARLLMNELGYSFDPRISLEITAYSSALIENRYRTINQLLKTSGIETIIDIPCGYTPRAIDPEFREQVYIGLDLPAVIDEISPVHQKILQDREMKPRIFAGIDATNYDSFRGALNSVEGEVIITSEGLMMYFSEAELKAFISNISRILHEFGGLWISFDMETNRLTSTVIKTIMTDEIKQALYRLKGDYVENQNIWRFENSITVDKDGSLKSIKKVENYLNQFGLSVERVSVADHMPQLEGLKTLPEKVQAELREKLKPVSLWIMRPEGEDYSLVKKISQEQKSS